MKTVNLKEAHTPYHVAIDEAPVSGEVFILEKDGQPVAAVVPMTEYTAFRVWREAEERRQIQQAKEAAIEQEHKTFLQMLPDLLKQYPGQVIALHNGRVVAVGDGRMEVWQEARKQLGDVPVYVQTVEYPPKRYKMPNRKVIVDVGI